MNATLSILVMTFSWSCRGPPPHVMSELARGNGVKVGPLAGETPDSIALLNSGVTLRRRAKKSARQTKSKTPPRMPPTVAPTFKLEECEAPGGLVDAGDDGPPGPPLDVEEDVVCVVLN